MAGDSAFISALVINSAVAIIFIALFVVLRKWYPRIYNPRGLLNKDLGLPPMGNGVFAWALEAWRMSDDDFYRIAGMDALIYTCFFRYGLYIFACCSIYGVIILIPVNNSASGTGTCTVDNSTDTSTDTMSTCNSLDTISLTNVPANDNRLWAHLISAYLFVGITLYFMGEFYKLFIRYRLKYFGEGRSNCHTIMVRDIPHEFADAEKLKRMMHAVYGDEVVETSVVLRAATIHKMVAARDKAIKELEHVRAVRAMNPKKKAPRKRLGGYICCGGEVVDAESFLKKKIHNLNVSIKSRQKHCEMEPKFCSAAFVTFKTIATAAKAMQPFVWTVDPAPEARDVHWDNCKMGYQQRYIRDWLFNAATFALVLFWVIPVAFVASLTTLEALSKRLPFLEPIVNSNAAVKGFLEGFLPTLALLIFMSILPSILTAFSTAQGIPALSWINFSMLRKYFWFQVVNVFFVSLIAGSAFEALDSLVNSPTSIVPLLGTSIPETGYFFTNYVMLQALSSYPGELLRIVDLIIYKLKYRFLAKSDSEKDDTWAPSSFDYGSALPGELLVVLIGLTYATVAPIMLPFAVIFFFAGYIVYRHNMLHVYEAEYETGGMFFSSVFNRVMAAVIIYEITLVGIFGLKKLIAQTLLMIPLIIYTLYFWTSRNTIYEPLGQVISQEEAVAINKEFNHTPNEYRVPELNADPTEGSEEIGDISKNDEGTPGHSTSNGNGNGHVDLHDETHPLESVV